MVVVEGFVARDIKQLETEINHWVKRTGNEIISISQSGDNYIKALVLYKAFTEGNW